MDPCEQTKADAFHSISVQKRSYVNGYLAYIKTNGNQHVACMQTLESVRGSEKEKKAPGRVCATATNSAFRVLRYCRTIWNWLHTVTIVLNRVQRILRARNITKKFVASKTL